MSREELIKQYNLNEHKRATNFIDAIEYMQEKAMILQKLESL